MAINVAISGFGRIGRLVLRSIIENNIKDLEMLGFNNSANDEVISF
jgi:glyceraldehyde 3-phosphate dehydrogenase